MNSTPYYVFDTDEFAKRAAMIKAALGNIHLCFSIKANPFLLHRIPDLTVLKYAARASLRYVSHLALIRLPSYIQEL